MPMKASREAGRPTDELPCRRVRLLGEPQTFSLALHAHSTSDQQLPTLCTS